MPKKKRIYMIISHSAHIPYYVWLVQKYKSMVPAVWLTLSCDTVKMRENKLFLLETNKWNICEKVLEFSICIIAFQCFPRSYKEKLKSAFQDTTTKRIAVAAAMCQDGERILTKMLYHFIVQMRKNSP